MRLATAIKKSLEHAGLAPALVPFLSRMARHHGAGLQRIFRDDDVWIHQTAFGYFAYHQPYVRLDLRRLAELTRTNFFWAYQPREGDIIIDVGAGAGEDTLTFAKAVGQSGTVTCVEAHPKTFRCLRALVDYNDLQNVVPIHCAIAEPGSTTATIGDSSDYLQNRLGESTGTAVPATTLDQLHSHLDLGRIAFLKINIEGAERLPIRGMTETLRQTSVVCVCCHDFLADRSGDETYRTKLLVH